MSREIRSDVRLASRLNSRRRNKSK